MASLNASSNPTDRTVYVGNLPATASVGELLNLVHFGPLESIKVLPEKSCVFLDSLTALLPARSTSMPPSKTFSAWSGAQDWSGQAIPSP